MTAVEPATPHLLPGDVLALRREELKTVARRYGITHLSVFGSVARLQDSAESDIDLLATFAPGSSSFDLAAFQQAAEDLLGLRVDVVSRSGLDPAIDADILMDARAL